MAAKKKVRSKKRVARKTAKKKRSSSRKATPRAGAVLMSDHGAIDTSKHKHGEAYELWDFLPAFVHPPGVHGTPHDHEVLDAPFETICGPGDDSQPVEQYDGTLGVTKQFVDDRERAVGQLQWNNNLAAIYDKPGDVSGVRWCTGTLISCDLLLSAGHCFDQSGGGWTRPKINGTNTTIPSTEIATNMHVNFNYQLDPNGNLRPVDDYPVIELVEYRLNGLDFAVARLGGNPGNKYGFTRIAPADASEGDMLAIIQHPAGVPKRIEAGPLTDLHAANLGYNDIDTKGGTSGSGVLGPNGTIVGVHTNGGCNPTFTGHNHGVRISSIIAASTTVSDLANKKMTFMDLGCRPKFKFADDPIKHVWQDWDPGIFKRFGDVKAAGYDWRWRFDPGIFFQRGDLFGGGATRSPFILSTPHHSQAASPAGAGQPAAPAGPGSESGSQLAELVQMLEFKSREIAELQSLYEQMVGQTQGPGGCGS